MNKLSANGDPGLYSNLCARGTFTRGGQEQQAVGGRIQNKLGAIPVIN